MESRQTELESKLSYAEDLLDALNRTVFRQQEQIAVLQRQVALLFRQINDMTPQEGGDPRQDIPPHY